MQYHSSESASVKEPMHLCYETIRSKTTDEQEKTEAMAMQEQISKLFKMPNGIESVKEI